MIRQTGTRGARVQRAREFSELAKTCGLFHALRLPKVPAITRMDDEKPRPNGETINRILKRCDKRAVVVEIGYKLGHDSASVLPGHTMIEPLSPAVQ